MVTVFVHRDGRTEQAGRVEPAWLDPRGGAVIWVDLAAPTPDEGRLLAEVFHFHELAVEDALAEIHHPKIESYDGYLYVILHGIDFQAARHRFATRDVDFFLGPTYLVTVSDGQSRSIARVRELAARNAWVLAEGPAALMHRIVDAMVDNYRPEVDRLAERIDRVEREIVERPRAELMRTVLALKRDIASLRHVTLPQRDVVARLARREFPMIGEQVTYRFRDVYDHLVRLADEGLLMQDQITGLLETHLASTSNQLNAVMKVLTVIATALMLPSVLAGLWGMNVVLPAFPGGPAGQFWWVLGLIAASVGAMLAVFRVKRWF
ncbi:MAG TPA: magnesium transporter CorA family protein [Vicinamibacterales bacterium]|nr:magnesium transporter CorA family protein [Vicinamibacterales bacterium]